MESLHKFAASSNAVMKYIYLIKNSEDDTYKIGVSKSPNKRLKEIQTGNGNELIIIEKYLTEHYSIIETTLHHYYSYAHKKGEWFSLSLSDEVSFIDKCKKIENGIVFLKENNNIFI